MMPLNNCKLIQLPKIIDARGNLSFVESNHHIPFEIKRIYYLYDIPSGTERGGHGHKALHQLVIPISGSFVFALDDGKQKTDFHLHDPSVGLYICPKIWRVVKQFSSNAVCLVLASEMYQEDDYFRDYVDFIHSVGNKDV
jgi:hypothetical protein